MKIFAYNVEPYEMEAFTKWMDETGIEVKLYGGLLTPESVEMTKGYDAVTTCQVPPMKDEEIYKSSTNTALSISLQELPALICLIWN